MKDGLKRNLTEDKNFGKDLYDVKHRNSILSKSNIVKGSKEKAKRLQFQLLEK